MTLRWTVLMLIAILYRWNYTKHDSKKSFIHHPSLYKVFLNIVYLTISSNDPLNLQDLSSLTMNSFFFGTDNFLFLKV